MFIRTFASSLAVGVSRYFATERRESAFAARLAKLDNRYYWSPVCSSPFQAFTVFSLCRKSSVDKERDAQLELAQKMSLKASNQMQQRLREVALLHKTRLQKRIKSKNYHRRAKRRNLKEFEKDIALLRANNPAAFAERLIEADRLRAKERASLRHKTGGKFAKMQRLRAKYDKEARDAVAHMQDNARDLTKRRQHSDDEEDSDAALSDADLSSSDDDEEDEHSSSEASGLDEKELTNREEAGIAPHLVNWWARVIALNRRSQNPLQNFKKLYSPNMRSISILIILLRTHLYQERVFREFGI